MSEPVKYPYMPDYNSIQLTQEEIDEALLEWKKRRFFKEKALKREDKPIESDILKYI